MKKLFCLVFVLAMVCSLLFAFNVSADEGTLNNIASESTITTNAGKDTWWIHNNKDNLKDGDPTTGMHSSNKEGTTVVTFTFPAERRITKIVMLVNGSATTSAVSPTDMNAATDYKVTVGGYTETKNALDQTELVFNLDQTTNTVTIEFKSNWGWSNALIREVEIYEYIPPVEEVFNGKNIEDEATIQTTDGNSYIVGGSNYLIDNDPFTGLSAGNAASWINYHFLYEEGRNINRVVVVVNSTGTMYKVGSADGTYVHETMSTLPNIYLRLYSSTSGTNSVYKLENVSTSKAVAVELNGKTYMAYTFDLGGEVYPDIVKVEVATVHNKDTKLGVWEVEIFEHQCSLDGHKFANATCAAPETCIYCGETQGEVSSEHTGTWSVATCTTLSTCSVCGATTGELDADNHTWKDATCNAPKTCVDCSVTEGEPTGEHSWVDVSCAAPKHCSGCGETEGEALPHANILKDGNCTTDDKCRVCKQVVVAAIAHNFDANGYCTNEGCYYRNIEKNVASSAEVTTSPAGWWAVGPKWWVDGDWNTGSHAPKSGTFSYIFTYGSEMNFSRFVIVANGLCYAPNDGKDANNNAIIGVKVTLKDADGNKVYETTAYGFDTNDIEIVLPYPMTAVSATFTFTSTQQYGSSFVREIEIYEPKIEGCGVHNFEVVQGATASCTVDGSYSVVCSVCKAVESVHVTPATGHKIGTDYVVINRTCTSAPVLQFACTVCGETEEREIQVNDIIDRADKTSITTIHSGGGTTASTMFDGNLNTWTQASGSWAVIGTINFDRAYYLSSVTVWIEGSSVGAGLIVYYQAPGSDEWIQAGDAMAVHAPWGEIGEFTYEIKEEIYASAIKVYVGDADGTPQGGGPGLYSFNGRLYDVAVTGSLEKEIAAGHTWVAGEAVAADCDDYGYTPYTCSVCGETKKSDFVNATGHKWVNATCAAPKTCSVCELTDGEALEHKYDEGVVTAPTCTVDGYTTYTCTDCGATKVEDTVAAAHTWSEYVETFPGTCVDKGSATYTCDVCGETKTEELDVDPNGHTADYSKDMESVDATCKADGYWTYYCLFCGEQITEVSKSTPDAHEFDWDKYVYVAPTCQTAGYEINVCALCEAEVRYEYDAGENWHTWDDGVAIEGGFHYVCTTCKVEKDEITLGTAGDPITAIIGDNTVVSYVANATEVYFYIASGAGTVTVTVDENAGIKIATSPMAMGQMNFETGSTTYTAEVEYGCFICISLDAEAYTVPETFNVSFEEKKVPELALGDNEFNFVAVNYYFGAEEVVFTATEDGTYVFTVSETGYIAITDGYNLETVETPYTVELVAGQTINFIVGTYANVMEYTEDTVVVTVLSESATNDNALLNGTYISADGSALFVFADGVLTITDTNEMFPSGFAGEYTYTYTAATGEIVLDPASINMSASNGTIYVFGRMPLKAYVPPVELVMGDNTVNFVAVNYYFGEKEVVFKATEDGIYVFTVSETGMLILVGDYTAEVVDTPYTVELVAGQTIKFAVSTSANPLTNTEDTVVVTVATHVHNYKETVTAPNCVSGGYTTFECDCGASYIENQVDALGHTEEVIPAVPASKAGVGYTSYIVCSVCGDTIKEKQEVSNSAYKVSALTLTLGENINIVYKNLVPATYTDVKVVFTLNTANGNIVYEAVDCTVDTSNRLCFVFEGVRLQFMADNIEAMIYAKTADGLDALYSYPTYSVKQYIVGQLGKSNDAEFKTMISDLLVLGDKAQVYAGYKTETMMSADVTNLTCSEYNGISETENIKGYIGEKSAIADWKTMTLLSGNATTIKYTVQVAKEELDNVVIVLTMGEEGKAGYRCEEFKASELKLADGYTDRYVIEFNNIMVSAYGKTVTGKILHNGEQIGREYYYSVNSYLYSNQNYAVDATRDFLRAMYQYGASALAYVTK